MHDSSGLALLLALLTEHTGMELVGTRRDTALAVIARAMAEAGIASVDEYYSRVTAGQSDLDRLVDALSVGETYFFREPAQFDFVRNEIFAEIETTRGAEGLVQMWSAGCATGEEAYSLAILLDEAGIAGASCVLGTDISRAAVEGARTACYRPWSLRTLDDETIARYFAFDGSCYRLHERIRERAVFEQRNLVDPDDAAPLLHDVFDVVFLRNVLIYFDRSTVEAIVKRVAATLRNGGWLVTASCDPPIQGVSELQSVSKRGCVFYRRTITHKTVVDLSDLEIPLLDMRRPTQSAGHDDPSTSTVYGDSTSRSPAVEAFERGDYETVVRLMREQSGDAAACSLAVRAVANLSGSLAAYRDAEVACRDHPFSVELHYLRGLFLSDLGRHDDAADAFRRVTYLEPQLALGHYALGRALARIGHTQHARRSFQTAHDLCAEMDPASALPLTEGEPVAQLASSARLEIELLGGTRGEKR